MSRENNVTPSYPPCLGFAKRTTQLQRVILKNR